jgi:hypothetical protein
MKIAASGMALELAHLDLSPMDLQGVARDLDLTLRVLLRSAGPVRFPLTKRLS